MPTRPEWQIIKKLGEGGQGEVFLARSPGRALVREQAALRIPRIIREMAATVQRESYEALAPQLADAIAEYNGPDAPDELGALKRLKLPTADDERDRALQRFRNEINALKGIEDDPATLRVLDFDIESNWMVMEYHERGSLGKYQEMFKGDARSALEALRPVVAMVARLHSQNVVHRDIKLVNVFVTNTNRLVLGDFGIVFVQLDRRPTELLERVGSRDWMPPWAHTGGRIDDVKPTFDVFSLGKLLWTMIAGMPILPYWYHRRPPHDLTLMYPDDPAMDIINSHILDHCIVEEESACDNTAAILLRRVDEVLKIVSSGSQLIADGVPRPCRVCGRGQYESLGHGLAPVFGRVDAYSCSSCGHIQFFRLRESAKASGEN